MSVEDKLDRLIEASGEVRSSLISLEKYIGAVSSNQKATAEKLDKHMLDNVAHGQDVREKGSGSMIAWIGTGITGLLAAWDIFGKHK